MRRHTTKHPWFLFLWLWVACEGSSGEQPETVFIVSPDPESVSQTTPSVAGKVLDLFQEEPLGGAFVSTFPATRVFQVNPRGEFIFSEGIVPGRLYEVHAESNGYEPAVSVARAEPGQHVNLTLALIPTARAVPIRVEPSVLVFTPNQHAVEMTVSNESDAELSLAWEPPPWLEVEGEGAALRVGERRPLVLRVVPAAFAEALGAQGPGDLLRATLEVKDQFERIERLEALAIPAAAPDIVLGLEGAAPGPVGVGETVALSVSVSTGGRPLLGADVRAEWGEGVSVLEGGALTDSQGKASFQVVARSPGSHAVRVGLPSYPGVEALEVSLEVLAPLPCQPDERGRNACGEANRWSCGVDDKGGLLCEDVDECEIDEHGYNGCGEAQFWACANLVGAAPGCEDLDECQTDNGGCGDPAVMRCANQLGAAPGCEDLDECQTDNGGCGDPALTRCVNQAGAAPRCEDLDECALDADGNNACGVARFWACTNHEGRAPDCDDLRECASDNGGCGDPTFTRCVEQVGAAPLCEDIDECEADGQGFNDCGLATRWRCTNLTGAAPVCEDLDECLVDNGGCGDARRWRCVNQLGGEPACQDLDECAPDADGNNACGVARFWACTNHEGRAPDCDDLRECVSGNGGCGDPTFTRCVEQVGAPARCEDIDECAPDGEGRNACGQASAWICQDRQGAAPVCVDLNECLTNNGGCGDPGVVRCINRQGQAPSCQDVTSCTPGVDGQNFCGVARLWRCTERPGDVPLCQDLDECAVDEQGNNACGVARFWACTNLEGRDPACQDLDECAANNGACAMGTRCVNRLGAPSACEDLDECLADNGGCGDPGLIRCVNRYAAAPGCEDIDNCALDEDGLTACGDPRYWRCQDRFAQPPVCEDIDNCAPDGQGQNDCGDARLWDCTDRQGAAPLCEDIDECLTDNGGCGDSARIACLNREGQVRVCEDVDECEPDPFGLNECGEAVYFDCVNHDNAPPTCADKDECVADGQGNNGCGAAVSWTCTNNLNGPPTCVDIAECATSNGGCGSTNNAVCVEQIGAPPICQDVNECLNNNGNCGSPEFALCVNRVQSPRECLDIDNCAQDEQGMNYCGQGDFWACTDRAMQAPTCVDIDECQVIGGRTGCGSVLTSLCTNRIGEAPLCVGCADGTVNLNLQTGDGCEYSCVADGGEACDGRDNDCDGLFDEGFDTRSDPAHCGACGHDCGAAPGVEDVDCQGGVCLVLGCQAGLADLNGDLEDGCEAQDQRPVLYVDAASTAQTPDGTQGAPFPTISAAIAAAQPGTTILVLPGRYVEMNSLSRADVWLVGSSTDEVSIAAPTSTSTILSINAPDVRVERISFLGGAVGVHASNADGLVLRDLTVTTLRPPTSTQGAAATSAVGIFVQDSQSPSVLGNRILDLRGGDGSVNTSNGRPSDGGHAQGIYLLRTPNCVARGNANDTRPGGPGGNSGSPTVGRNGSGGAALGIDLRSSSGCALEGNRVSGLTGGASRHAVGTSGSDTFAGFAGNAFGIYLNADTNTTARDNEISSLLGLAGGNGNANQRVTSGGTAAGILVQSSPQTFLEGNRASLLQGGPSGLSSANMPAVAGGPAYGVRVLSSPRTSVEGFAGWSIHGNMGAPASPGQCVRVESSTDFEASFLTCHNLGRNNGSGASSAVYFHTDQTGAASVTHLIASDVSGYAVEHRGSAGVAQSGWIDAYQCTQGATLNTRAIGPVYALDPLFLNASAGELRLLPTSPLIDVGSPEAPFEAEVEPNGCLADLGAYGNSARSTPSPSASHCPP